MRVPTYADGQQAQATMQTDTFHEAMYLLKKSAISVTLDQPLDESLNPLLRGRLAMRAMTVDLAVDTSVRDAAYDILLHGWAPTELFAFAQRRYGEHHLSYLRDALASTVHCSYSSAWLRDLKKLGADVWWSVGGPHLSQWVRSRRLNRAEAVRVAIDVLALLTYLPRTDEVHAPAPAEVLPEVPAGTLVADPRVLAKIEALLARAASSDYSDEAAACARKAQELMVRYATVPPEVDLALVLRSLFATSPVGTARALLAGVQGLRRGRSLGEELAELVRQVAGEQTGTPRPSPTPRELTGRTA